MNNESADRSYAFIAGKISYENHDTQIANSYFKSLTQKCKENYTEESRRGLFAARFRCGCRRKKCCRCCIMNSWRLARTASKNSCGFWHGQHSPGGILAWGLRRNKSAESADRTIIKILNAGSPASRCRKWHTAPVWVMEQAIDAQREVSRPFEHDKSQNPGDS